MKKKLLEIAWRVNFILFSTYEIRLIYEQTYLTWLRGDQMIGYSIMHVYPFYVLSALVATIIAWLFLIYAIFKIGFNLIKNKSTPKLLYIKTGLLIFSFLLFYIPYPWWKSLTVLILGQGKI